MLRPKNLDIQNVMTVTPQTQIECREVEPNPSKDKTICKREISFVLKLVYNVCLWGFFLTVLKIHIRIYHASTEVLSYWPVETIGDLLSTSRGLDRDVKFKIYAIPILMHQMRISTTCVSSVILRPKIWISKMLWL
jgi:hypothetical protein